MRTLTYLLLATITFISCSKDKDKEILSEAYEIHKELRDIQKDIISKIPSLDSLAKHNTDAAIIKKEYLDWKKDILEVPGFPHIHLPGDDHSHEHHAQKQLPAREILEIQKGSKEKAKQIQAQIDSLL